MGIKQQQTFCRPHPRPSLSKLTFCTMAPVMQMPALMSVVVKEVPTASRLVLPLRPRACFRYTRPKDSSFCDGNNGQSGCVGSFLDGTSVHHPMFDGRTESAAFQPRLLP